MPLALEQFDLSGYDLVISSESGPAKGVLAPSSARHICYCHTPMRYLWDLYSEYLNEWHAEVEAPPLFALSAGWLRQWDYTTAGRVDEVPGPTARTYGGVSGAATGGNPRWSIRRVDVERFCWKEPGDYYLVVSHLVPYKRVDVAVRGVFPLTGAGLRVVGGRARVPPAARHGGAPMWSFCGHVSDPDLPCLLRTLPGAGAAGRRGFRHHACGGHGPSGKPVIAYGRGGVLESVPAGDPQGGFFYPEPGEEALTAALERFEASRTPGAARRTPPRGCAVLAREF